MVRSRLPEIIKEKQETEAVMRILQEETNELTIKDDFLAGSEQSCEI
jgi:hypothetical protein